MREFTTPAPEAAPLSGNLTDDVVRHARSSGDAVRFRRHDGGAGNGEGGGADGGAGSDASSGWRDVTSAEFRADVEAVASGLIAAGVEPGDRVILMASTRYEWTVVDYAIWFAGAVGVPVYATAPPARVQWIVRDSGARAAVVEDDALRERLGEAAPALVWLLDAPGEGHGAFAELTALGDHVDPAVLEARRTTAGPEDLATVVYTSGTTGRPKGCRLTHGNLMAELDAAQGPLGDLFDDDAATLLFLPLAHVFARVVQIGCVRAGVRLGHTGDLSALGERMREFEPTFLLAVPRVFEKIFTTASQRATADGRGPAFDRAAEVATEWSRARDRGRVPLRLKARHAAYDRTAYAALRDSFGGRCTVGVAGGAPLGERLSHFFRGIGMPVLEGWGLTETAAALTVNSPEAHKIGTVGRPLPGTGVRVADDGEILVRGPQVFAGYWTPDPEAADAPADPFTDDGWLATGDVGEVDDEGFVRITGRKREILVTAGGKVVSPTVLEERLRAHPLVSQALVVGDRQPFVGALLTIDPDAFPAWAAGHGVPTDPEGLPDLVEDPTLLAELQKAVDRANLGVSQAEAIRRFAVLPRDWSEETGELTPALKLRRNVVLRRYRDDVAALYV